MWGARRSSNTASPIPAWVAAAAAGGEPSWEEQAFERDAAAHLGGCVWPPRSYSCTFCQREFRSAQALGGYMNVHRRDRALLRQGGSSPDDAPNDQPQQGALLYRAASSPSTTTTAINAAGTTAGSATKGDDANKTTTPPATSYLSTIIKERKNNLLMSMPAAPVEMRGDQAIDQCDLADNNGGEPARIKRRRLDHPSAATLLIFAQPVAAATEVTAYESSQGLQGVDHDAKVVGTDHLRDVGMKIVRKCDGLPLAVKVMGGLLCTRSRSEREWEAVLNHHAWSVDGLPKELDSRIYLSYDDLSPQLKQCFLYCSLFPKGTYIWWRQVIPMWISEGFIQSQADKSSSHDDQLEEIATEYYEELITRNLIEPTKESSLTGYTCTMHDVVRSFAEFMAREESLVVQDTQVATVSNDSRVRRLSIGPTISVPGLSALQKQESLRTLFINFKINFEPRDSLNSFSRLRVLSIQGGDCDRLVGSLCQLRHLRYLGLEKTNISRLPDDIHNMKFLQHIVLCGSMYLENLPRSIIKLVHLRTLNMSASNANVAIPKEFGGLTNLRTLLGFPVHMDTDGGWCSLEEIGPLSQLRKLSLHGLENVCASSSTETARVSSKEHLDYLELNWSSSRWMELRDEIEKQQHQQQAVEEVLEKLRPPPSVQHLIMEGYFGRTLPNWMMVPATGAFKSLMFLRLEDLPCCSKLPDGLCRLPSLKALTILYAPAIKSVGSEFQASSSSTVGGVVTASTSAAFPNLTKLALGGLCEWEEWDWEEQTADVAAGTMAMHDLEELAIDNCKLRCLPPGLASSKRLALRQLSLYGMTNLTVVENFPSVVELDVFDCPELKRISGLSRLHKIRIVRCPKLEVLEGVPSLDSLVLHDATMEALPGYLQVVHPRFLELACSKKLCESLSPGSSEWNKINHIRKHRIGVFKARWSTGRLDRN